MIIRIFLAGILGAITMFTWQYVAHMVLPLGEAGIAEIPNESALASAMQSSIGDKAGIYTFPGTGLGPNATGPEIKEAMQRMPENYATNPSGLLIYHPPGRPFTLGKWLVTQLGTDVVITLLAVFLLAQARLATFGARLGFMTVVGVIAAIATNIPYWNWYGFTGVYTAANVIMEIVGFICAGFVAALVLKNTPPRLASQA